MDNTLYTLLLHADVIPLGNQRLHQLPGHRKVGTTGVLTSIRCKIPQTKRRMRNRDIQHAHAPYLTTDFRMEYTCRTCASFENSLLAIRQPF